MKILFIHQNFPGQFLHLAPALVAAGHDVQVLTDHINKQDIGIRTWRYRYEAPKVYPEHTRLGRNYTVMSDRGTVVARAAQALRNKGYYPDLIIGHSGWGETLFLKEVWPEAKLLVYSEFYYRGTGADVGFDPEFSNQSFDQMIIAQARAAYLCQSIVHADRAIAPTEWQKSTCPALLQSVIDVAFDGVDTRLLRPDPTAEYVLPQGEIIRAGDEVLTFVNRNMEPYRGYHIFMRALPKIMAERPDVKVVLVGGDSVSYGAAPAEGKGWKDVFLNEVSSHLDLSRVHFVGKVSHRNFVKLMQVTRSHAYLTYPFVLSWSMIEALSAGALVVGSKTAPVEEVITHGKNGLLVDFFDIQAWSDVLIDTLADPKKYNPLRKAGRRTVVDKYELNRVCLPRQLALIDQIMAG